MTVIFLARKIIIYLNNLAKRKFFQAVFVKKMRPQIGGDVYGNEKV